MDCTRLKNLQKERKDRNGKAAPPLIPVGDVANRWHSQYIMVDRIHEIKPYYVQLCAELDIPDLTLTAIEWTTVQRMRRVLGPFFLVTKGVSSNLACISGN